MIGDPWKLLYVACLGLLEAISQLFQDFHSQFFVHA